jgi:phosphoribosylglycinamide formyltransferase 2
MVAQVVQGDGGHGSSLAAATTIAACHNPPKTAAMTTLGTPLSPSATRVLLLGSGELGKEVLIALQRLGVETIAVDRYDNAPGQQVATTPAPSP